MNTFYNDAWLAILSTRWSKSNISMTPHEGIKQYNNKLIRLIENWYKFQTPTALFIFLQVGCLRYGVFWSLIASMFCRWPAKLTVILLAIVLARFHSNGLIWVGLSEKCFLLIGTDLLYLFDKKKNNRWLCCNTTNHYCRQRRSVHKTTTVSCFERQPRGKSRRCLELIALKNMM